MTQETARFYTKSRRFPKMIGRMNDGSRIPGGPYTLTQVGVGGAVLLVLIVTRDVLWGTGEILVDLLLIALFALASLWLVGLLPITRRNVLLALIAAVAAMFKPFRGRYQGQPIRLAAPHGTGGSTLVLPLEQHTPAAAPSRVSPERTQPTPVVPQNSPATAQDETPARRPMSGVERLLAQAKGAQHLDTPAHEPAPH